MLLFFCLVSFVVPIFPFPLSSFSPLSLCLAAPPRIIDYQDHLPQKFKKQVRQATRFIIIHDTESGLQSALNSLSRGGHINYVVDRNGDIYRLLDKQYRADHAGLSMWEGVENISSQSVGIELVGYYNDPFTDSQYTSLSWLVKVLQKQYHIPDWLVLEHYRVAYGRPNAYVKSLHRGRRKDPGIFNFDRARIGLTSNDPRNNVLHDPDVAAGRLIPDPDINVASLKRRNPQKFQQEVAALSSNTITATNTAWRIAREDYNDSTTRYRFPGGKVLRGDQIKDWANIPVGTQVTLHSRGTESASQDAILEITDGATALDRVGKAYRRSDTIYIFPKGTIKNGTQIKDWGQIPPGTKVLVGYHAPVPLTKATARTQAVRAAQDHHTVFLIPTKRVLSASQVKNAATLPAGTLMFVKK